MTEIQQPLYFSSAAAQPPQTLTRGVQLQLPLAKLSQRTTETAHNPNVRVQCCFTSTETIRTVRDGVPRTATSTFTQLLSSEPQCTRHCLKKPRQLCRKPAAQSAAIRPRQINARRVPSRLALIWIQCPDHRTPHGTPLLLPFPLGRPAKPLRWCIGSLCRTTPTPTRPAHASPLGV